MVAASPELLFIGDVGVDLVMGPIAQWPRVGTESIVERCELRAGGSSGNAALAVGLLGGQARLISGVGRDDFGVWLRGQFGGLELALQVCDVDTTVTVGLLHSCGERTFFTTRGHLEHLAADHVRASLRPARAAGSIALLSGPFLTPALRRAYPALIEELARLGYCVALDTGWPPEGWSEATRAEVRTWIGRCQHVLVNEIEATSLAGNEDAMSALHALSQDLAPGATLVVKSGADGAIAWQDGATVSHRAAPADIFDTVGAGDAFNAGYLLARLNGEGLAAALAAGCTTATAIIARFPRRSIAAGELAGLLAGALAHKEPA